MKKALVNTKVAVKLRKSETREEWYLYIESYPVFQSVKRNRNAYENISIAPSPHLYGTRHALPEPMLTENPRSNPSVTSTATDYPTYSIP